MSYFKNLLYYDLFLLLLPSPKDYTFFVNAKFKKRVKKEMCKVKIIHFLKISYFKKCNIFQGQFKKNV